MKFGPEVLDDGTHKASRKLSLKLFARHRCRRDLSEVEVATLRR